MGDSVNERRMGRRGADTGGRRLGGNMSNKGDAVRLRLGWVEGRKSSNDSVSESVAGSDVWQ